MNPTVGLDRLLPGGGGGGGGGAVDPYGINRSALGPQAFGMSFFLFINLVY